MSKLLSENAIHRIKESLHRQCQHLNNAMSRYAKESEAYNEYAREAIDFESALIEFEKIYPDMDKLRQQQKSSCDETD